MVGGFHAGVPEAVESNPAKKEEKDLLNGGQEVSHQQNDFHRKSIETEDDGHGLNVAASEDRSAVDLHQSDKNKDVKEHQGEEEEKEFEEVHQAKKVFLASPGKNE